MEILIFNAGSSSLKFSMFETTNFDIIARGVCERIGLKESFIQISSNEEKIKSFLEIDSHSTALKLIMKHLTKGKTRVINKPEDIELICHMFVHGGKLTKPTIADKKVIDYLKNSIDYAPLHMPRNISVLEDCIKLFPNTVNAIYFDSNFHSTLPKFAQTYPINQDIAKKYNIKRYGFHGSSHEFMTQKAVEHFPKANKIISCHLGNGCSISAIKNGKCVDTSMGFTPLEGLMMGTRSGSIDPGIICFLEKKCGYSSDDITNLLNNQSGLKGICGFSDLRDIEKQAIQGNKNCKLALEMYAYSILKTIGSLFFVLGGVDVITFGGGVGENSATVREMILNNLKFLNIEFDSELNKKINRMPDVELSTKNSKTKILVVSTNEEIVIAKKIFDIYLKKE